MKYTFHCRSCHKIVLCDTKEQVKELKDKHWVGYGPTRHHTPALQTMHIETRTSKRSNRPYLILIAD